MHPPRPKHSDYDGAVGALQGSAATTCTATKDSRTGMGVYPWASLFIQQWAPAENGQACVVVADGGYSGTVWCVVQCRCVCLQCSISLWDIRFMPTRSVFTFFQTFLNFWRNAPKCRHLGGGMCMLFEICGKTPFQKCMGWGG